MRTWRRVLRMLAAGGLIPLVLAAGLPVQACACDAAAPKPNCCCGSVSSDAKCKTGGCPCCKAARRTAAPESTDKAATKSPIKTSVLGCRCGSAQPLPAPPASSGVVSVVDLGLPAATQGVIAPPRQAARSSHRRERAALLPVTDLTLLYGALVI